MKCSTNLHFTYLLTYLPGCTACVACASVSVPIISDDSGVEERQLLSSDEQANQ